MNPHLSLFQRPVNVICILKYDANNKLLLWKEMNETWQKKAVKMMIEYLFSNSHLPPSLFLREFWIATSQSSCIKWPPMQIVEIEREE